MKILFLTLFLLTINTVFAQNNVQINSQLSNIIQDMGNKEYKIALSSIHRLIQQNPNDSNLHRYYAEILSFLNYQKEALSNINKAILLSKETSSNYIIAGNIYRELQDYTNAKNSYDKAISLDPGISSVYTEYALLNLHYRFLDEAERLSQLAFHYDPNAWQNVILKASIAEAKKNSEEAQEIFLNGIKKFPYEEALIDTLAEFYLYIKEWDKAIIILQKANTRFGDSIIRNEMLGDLFLSKGDFPQSLQYYELVDQTVRDFPLPASALLKWKIYYLNKILSNTEVASTFLQEAFELEPLNQLYLIEFYHYLISTDNTTLRNAVATYLQKRATLERQKGIGYYYLSLLQKIIMLDPSLNDVRKKLIDYAQLQNNQYQIGQLLQESYQQQPDNTSLKRTLDLRKHLAQTQRLNTKKRQIHQYTNKVFIEDNSEQFQEAIKNEIHSIELFFPTIYSSIDLTENFQQETRALFHNNTNYNLVTHLQIDSTRDLLTIDIYDKEGTLLTSYKLFFRPDRLSELLIFYTEKITKLLPPIGFITQRMPSSAFNISLTQKQITNNSKVAILDKDFFPITTATVTSATFSDAIIQQDKVPLSIIDLKNSFVVPIEYVPSLWTNEQGTTTSNTNIIQNIMQVSQPHYTPNISFP